MNVGVSLEVFEKKNSGDVPNSTRCSFYLLVLGTSWNPRETLSRGRPGPPRSLSGLRPQSFQLLAKKQQAKMASGSLKQPTEGNDTPILALEILLLASSSLQSPPTGYQTTSLAPVGSVLLRVPFSGGFKERPTGKRPGELKRDLPRLAACTQGQACVCVCVCMRSG